MSLSRFKFRGFRVQGFGFKFFFGLGLEAKGSLCELAWMAQEFASFHNEGSDVLSGLRIS